MWVCIEMGRAIRGFVDELQGKANHLSLFICCRSRSNGDPLMSDALALYAVYLSTCLLKATIRIG